MAPRRCLGATLLWVCGSVTSTAAQTYPIDGSALGGVVQLEIAPNMRAILIDWLVEVHADFHLAPTSLHLAVNLLE